MNYDIEFTESGPFEVVVTTSGEASGAEIEAGRRRVLADPRFRPGMSILLDHSLLDNTGAEAHEVRGLASSLDRDRASSGFAYLAIVAPDAVTLRARPHVGVARERGGRERGHRRAHARRGVRLDRVAARDRRLGSAELTEDRVDHVVGRVIVGTWPLPSNSRSSASGSSSTS